MVIHDSGYVCDNGYVCDYMKVGMYVIMKYHKVCDNR